MFKNNFLKTLIVLVVLISSFSYNQVPACMDSLITNPFLKFSIIYYIIYSIFNNHSNSLLISILILFIMDNDNIKINKPIDENESVEIILENEITNLEKEVINDKNEISKELKKLESNLNNEDSNLEIDSNIEEDSNLELDSNIKEDKLIDQQIKEVINIKSSRGIKDNCEDCNFIKENDYKIKEENFTGYDSKLYYSLI